MSTKVTINGNTYKVPNAGEPAGWGEDTTSVILDLITVVSALTGADYIAESTALLEVTQTTNADIPGILFRKEYTRSITLSYVIKINDEITPTNSLTEEGKLHISYNEGDSTWVMQREFSGDNSKIILSITNNGQIQYRTPGAATYAPINVSSINMHYKTESLISISIG